MFETPIWFLVHHMATVEVAPDLIRLMAGASKQNCRPILQ